MLLKIVYLLTCPVPGLAVLVFRGDRAKDAGLLVLRHVPRRRWTGIFPVTPATLLAWHRKLAGNRYDTSKRRKPGRPPAVPGIARLVVRVAKEDPLQGHRRIHGELTKPGVTVAPSTVQEILRAAGIDPAPRRPGPTWRQFPHAQAAGIVAVDFLHVDTVLLKRLHVLVFIQHGTRRMHLGGVTPHPTPPAVDGPAGPQPGREPRRAIRALPVPDPRPRLQLHGLIRRRLPGRRDHDLAHGHPGAPDETSGCILHLLWSVRGVLLLSLVETVAVGSDSPGGSCAAGGGGEESGSLAELASLGAGRGVGAGRRVEALALVVVGVAGDEAGVVPGLDGSGGHAEARWPGQGCRIAGSP